MSKHNNETITIAIAAIDSNVCGALVPITAISANLCVLEGLAAGVVIAHGIAVRVAHVLCKRGQIGHAPAEGVLGRADVRVEDGDDAALKAVVGLGAHLCVLRERENSASS